MRYTQSQIRELLPISVDAFRTWRDAIPALAAHKGHAPTFTPGDVVAMAIIAEIVRDFGIRIGTIANRLDQLCRECRGRSWLSLESCVVLIDASEIRLVDAETLHRPSLDNSTMVVPCAPIVARLQSALATTEADQPQGYLHFPPTAISTPPERRRKRA